MLWNGPVNVKDRKDTLQLEAITLPGMDSLLTAQHEVHSGHGDHGAVHGPRRRRSEPAGRAALSRYLHISVLKRPRMGLRKVFKKFATALKVFERFAERNAAWADGQAGPSAGQAGATGGEAGPSPGVEGAEHAGGGGAAGWLEPAGEPGHRPRRVVAT